MANVRINMKVLLDSIEPEVERKTINIAREMASELLETRKELLLERVEKDAVSQELLAENSIFQSQYIAGGGTDKYGGNLYSFFGFEIEEENPVTQLIDYLTEAIGLNKATKLSNGVYRFKVIAPTMKTIESQTELPWIHRSWIKAVENGLSNVKHYIRILDGSPFSRSEEGLQIKNTMNKTFRPKRYYFTDRYKAFLERISRPI